MSVRGYWADLRAPAFRALPADCVAVLPIGATEQHGPHLPVSVDADLVRAVSARMLEHLGTDQSVLILPTLTVTKSGEHDRHPGTLSLSGDTLAAVIRDIGASVARAGVARLVLFNGHGGNTGVLTVVARDLRIAHGMIVATCAWSGFAETEGLFDPAEYARDLHAGDSETSAMLAVKPGLVEMAEARDFRTAIDGWERDLRHTGLTGQPARPAWIIDDLNPDGACGNAAAATVEKGEAMIASAARNFADFLAEFARFDLAGRGS